MQKQIKSLQSTTIETLEHALGMIRSWKREFTVGEFITFTNKLEIIMRNVIESDIKTSTSTKGYMTGFQGFFDVTNCIRNKL